MELKCSSCLVMLPVENFSKKASKSRWYSYKCKECQNSYNREKWYPNNKEKVIESNQKWRKKFPLKRQIQSYKKIFTKEEIESYFSQERKCKICGSEEKLCVDHCHSTNKFRWILCTKCNTWIWMFKNNVLFLENAIKYLNW